jgi:hypothetical protein
MLRMCYLACNSLSGSGVMPRVRGRAAMRWRLNAVSSRAAGPPRSRHGIRIEGESGNA